jgi:predicted ester cyclase
MFTRRTVLSTALGASAALEFPAVQRAAAQAPNAQLERNKAVVRRFKALQGTKDEPLIEREILAPNYKRFRAGMAHLGANAQDQGFPSNGPNLRGAFPDRHDEIVDIIAEGDQVGLLFRMQGTHKGHLNGIPPTGKTVDVQDIAVFRLADGRITQAWFMSDEASLLKQLGAKLPPRKDGKLIVPPITGEGEDPDVVLKRLEAGPLATPQDKNRLMVARSKGNAPPASDRAPDFRATRAGFQHMRDYGVAKGVASETITVALPDRRDRLDGFLAEGDKVWMRFKVAGTHGGKLYGMAPTGKRVEVPEIGIMRIVDGKWKEAWYFGDELGMMLQLGALHMLEV